MELKHKHTFFLKCKGFSKKQFFRECGECGKKAKLTKYKICK